MSNLIFPKLSKTWADPSVPGFLTRTHLFNNIQGNKAGYSIKSITLSPTQKVINININPTFTTFQPYPDKTGLTYLNIILKHSSKSDVILSNCEVEVTKAPALTGITFTNFSKEYDNTPTLYSNEIFTNINFPSGVSKNDYTIKKIIVTSAGLGGVGRDGTSIVYDSTGTIKFETVLQYRAPVQEDTIILSCTATITKNTVQINLQVDWTMLDLSLYPVISATNIHIVPIQDVVNTISRTQGNTKIYADNIAFVNPDQNVFEIPKISEIKFTLRGGVGDASISISTYSENKEITEVRLQKDLIERFNYTLKLTSTLNTFNNNNKTPTFTGSITIKNSFFINDSGTLKYPSSLSDTLPNIKRINWNIPKLQEVQTTAIGLLSKAVNVQSIILPTNLRVIDKNFANGVIALHSIEITPNVKTIRDYAFKNCTNLSHISFPNSVQFIGEDVLYGCTNLKTVQVPRLRYKWFIEKLNIPDNIIVSGS